ncbi:hypothetical protein DFA_08770 [Cavenderia fasciculata]|uniref:Thiamin pyrophosphokinase thiamin-binding domain-containing protein n=1 Tax=Cavenderia fasciculata TaxID=261658 RepID=F4Q469_CACFS|nr:uncharacterized protein DFA_08770 [Cavenderia fasciculata]EGG17771.1 hypothetical protein DFA_08770 [Cavenderia fasciculata]|eukprot:XP_004356255.1 hypothetical protein DFA_08770 [Cavenderia fasciculata]
MMNSRTWNCNNWSPMLKASRSSSAANEVDVAKENYTYTPTRPHFNIVMSAANNQQQLEEEKNCLIICNSNIAQDTFEYLWSKSILVICADGGANQLNRYFQDKGGDELVNKWIPDFIKGDLDSLDNHVKDYYTSKGSIVMSDKSQDTTDLQKTMELVNSIESQYSFKFSNIFISGGLGGNISHEFANLNVLFEHTDRNLVLFSSGNFAYLLNSGCKHTINIKKDVHCSLIPLAGPAQSVTTTGLKWNLSDNSLKFGELISTSNITSQEIVTLLIVLITL